MKIPIENIYYLLCYAWNKLEEKDRVKVNVDEQTQLIDLFAKILINATKILLKRGIDRSYVEETREIPGVKGKIQIAESMKRNLLAQQRTICSFDEFSPNILISRILLTTIYKLTYTKELNNELKDQLRKLLNMFAGIEMITLNSSKFRQVRLNRNNRFYGFIINVCEIIYENSLPTEDPGRFTFKDFTRDERKMNQLFEAFVRNFYKMEQKKFPIVKKEEIKWKIAPLNVESDKHLPRMETDITLENETEKIIMDAKYYTETMSSYYDSEKIHSVNLYQLFSYLLNQESTEQKTKKATGILLYPAIKRNYDLTYQYESHTIKIKTIDLNVHWHEISNRLKNIIE